MANVTKATKPKTSSKLHIFNCLGNLLQICKYKYALALRRLHVILNRRFDQQYQDRYIYHKDYVEMPVKKLIEENIPGLTTPKACRIFFEWCTKHKILEFHQFGKSRWYTGYSVRFNPLCKFTKEYFKYFSFAGQTTLKLTGKDTPNNQDLDLTHARENKLNERDLDSGSQISKQEWESRFSQKNFDQGNNLNSHSTSIANSNLSPDAQILASNEPNLASGSLSHDEKNTSLKRENKWEIAKSVQSNSLVIKSIDSSDVKVSPEDKCCGRDVKKCKESGEIKNTACLGQCKVRNPKMLKSQRLRESHCKDHPIQGKYTTEEEQREKRMKFYWLIKGFTDQKIPYDFIEKHLMRFEEGFVRDKLFFARTYDGCKNFLGMLVKQIREQEKATLSKEQLREQKIKSYLEVFPEATIEDAKALYGA